jgi:energy-coupling factor transporter ATP-binding protein EcfA2
MRQVRYCHLPLARRLIGSSDLYKLLNPVRDASHDRAGPVAKCYPGTRERVISEITRCIEKGEPICWLNGPAGSGKSAISHAIAELYAAKGRLAADFFFFRGAGKRSKIAGLIPTLAYRLSISLPATKSFILKRLEDDPDIFHKAQKHQFMKLIIEPIRATTKSRLSFLLPAKPLVIVIDGLDECDDKPGMAEFITAVVDTFLGDPRLPLQIFVTSRVEEHIRDKLAIPGAYLVSRHLALEQYDANIDIRAFFQSRFSEIRHVKDRLMKNVPTPWPSEGELDILVEKSGGLFIFAVTLMRFMDVGTVPPGESLLPQERLRTALTAEVGLDTLYRDILSVARRDHNFDQVIGTVMLLRSPLPITFLGHLLQLSAEAIVQSVWGIQSILKIPGNDDEPIQLFHTSLRDFLVAPGRSSSFYINPPTRHLSIVIDCLKAMRTKPTGIIFQGGQIYACLNWCHHVVEGLKESGGDCLFDSSLGTSLTDCLADFASQTLDIWVNTMVFEKGWISLLDILDLGLSPLKVCALSMFCSMAAD